jgi:hypothetical protein
MLVVLLLVPGMDGQEVRSLSLEEAVALATAS